MPCQDVATGEWRHINHALAAPGASPTPATDIRHRRDFSLLVVLYYFILLFLLGCEPRKRKTKRGGQCCLPLFLLSWMTPTKQREQTTQPASVKKKGGGHKKRRHRQDGNEIPASLAPNCSGGTLACCRSIFPNTTEMEEEEEEESWSSGSLPGRLPLACRATEGTDKDTIGLSSTRTSQFGL